MPEAFVITVAIIKTLGGNHVVWPIYRSVQRKQRDTTSKQLARLRYCAWEKSCTSCYPKFQFSIGLNLPRIMSCFFSINNMIHANSTCQGPIFCANSQIERYSWGKWHDLVNWTHHPPRPPKKTKQTTKPSPNFISGEAIRRSDSGRSDLCSWPEAEEPFGEVVKHLMHQKMA